MDSAHSHQSSPSSTSTIAHATSHLRPSTLPAPSAHSKRCSEPTPGRQHRLLQSRNAKFPAKKLSLSNLGSRFTQLIHANDEPQTTDTPIQNQENCSPLSNQETVHKKRHVSSGSLGILEELSNTTVHRKSQRSGDIPIFQDTPERPLPKRSPFSSPTAYQDIFSQDCSPLAFDRMQETSGDMRLREISGNEHRGSPNATSPFNVSVKATKKRKSIQVRPGFDTQEYIDHLEKELQHARSEMISPKTNRSLKDQLEDARHNNERLERDMSDMRDLYEAEVKRTLEHKATLEVELKRQVRDLEEELELKTSIIEDLELQHDERRLDTSTIDTLKATIEKLEQDKTSLEDENRSVSKRNEVLSELLAMSPTKMQNFELRSPIRDKRGTGRPMSMILPRIPTSPTGGQISQAASAVASPSLSACGSFFNPSRSRVGSPSMVAHNTGIGLGLVRPEALEDMTEGSNVIVQGYFDQQRHSGPQSRRSTLQSQVSLNDTMSILSNISSPTDQVVQRVLPKRKPRKFMSGSTQLKPLLLPALNGDIKHTTSSATSSPLVDLPRDLSEDSIDPTTYFLSQPEDVLCDDSIVTRSDISVHTTAGSVNDNAAAGYKSFEEIIAEHQASADTGSLSSSQADVEVTSESSICEETILEQQSGTEAYNNLLTELASEDVEQLTNFEQENMLPASTSTNDLLKSLAHPFPQHVGLDFNALDSLHLPEPEYDALPTANTSTDATLLTDVPQPLFSIHAHHPQLSPTNMPTYTTSSGNWKEDGLNSDAPYLGLAFQRCSACVDATASQIPKTTEGRQTAASRGKPKTYSLLQMHESVSSHRSESLLRPRLANAENLAKAKGPLDVLRSSKLGAKPLAALTIKTIFATITKCSGHLQDFRKDPLGLARRVIANAWFANWARFGRLSWWVLGLFVSTDFGGPKLKKWDWESYDGEEIARRACQEYKNGQRSNLPASQRSLSAARQVKFNNASNCMESLSATAPKNGWGRSLMLWGKFSIAIMLAVGGAVVKGPGELLKETEKFESEHNVCSYPGNNRSMCDCPLHQTTINNKLDRPTKPTPRKRYDRYPSPVVLPPTRRSSSLSTLSSDTNPDKYHAESFQSWRQAVDLDDDETLRAISHERTHVADVFQHMGSNSFGDRAGNIRDASDEGSLQLDVDSGIVQWPPSPGSIYSLEGNSIRKRNL